MIENELEILRKAKHPNIIKLVEEYKTDSFVYLIMEFLKAGDLLDDLSVKKTYNEKDASNMVADLASAISYLHSKSIVHRDLKLENILIQNLNDGSKTLKLGDFGLAEKIDDKLNRKCGSPIYVAPEILLGKPYGFEVDVWSLGIITYILLCGYAPYQGDDDDKTFELIKSNELLFQKPYWDDVSEGAIDLIKKMLDRDQKTRITAEEILKHKWIVEKPHGTKSTSILKNHSISNIENNLRKNPRF